MSDLLDSSRDRCVVYTNKQNCKDKRNRQKATLVMPCASSLYINLIYDYVKIFCYVYSFVVQTNKPTFFLAMRKM